MVQLEIMAIIKTTLLVTYHGLGTRLNVLINNHSHPPERSFGSVHLKNRGVSSTFMCQSRSTHCGARKPTERGDMVFFIIPI